MEGALAYFIVGTLVTLAVEWIRSVSSAIDGRLVNLLAWAVGVAATFIPTEVVPQFVFSGLDLEARLLAGAILAGVSSLVAEAKGIMSNARKIKAEALESVGEGDEVYGSPK